MTRFFDLFIFQTRPAPGLSRGRRAAFWAWNFGLLLLSALGLTLLSFLLATGPYALNIVLGYFERPLIFLLNFLPCAALVLFLYGVTGRAGLAFLLSAAVVVGLSAGSYYKLMFRDDPLMFADLLLIKEAGNMAGKYKLFLDWKLTAVLVCVTAGVLFLRLFVRGQLEWRARVVTALVPVIAAAALSRVYLRGGIYDVKTAYYARLSSQWSATQQYIAHGSVYPFLHSIRDAMDSPPEGYDKTASAALLAQYEDQDIPEGKKVNVLGLMLEAYNDFTKFGVPALSQNIYAPWHQLEAEGWSGDLITNIFAGGTVDTERCFITGFSALPNFRGKTNSYAWYFREQGYTVEGMHPSNQWFYNRINVNENLGFERYLFTENYFEALSGSDYTFDDIFFPEFIKAYREGTAGDKPYFNFSVTYQGHGPYNDDLCWWGETGEYVVADGTYTEAQQNILDNYFGSVNNTNQHLKELTDYLRDDDEPVVLVVFGDHNPWMGAGNSVYEAMGIHFDTDTQQGFLDYYSTRYIIWANNAAKKVLGSDFQGEGPALSPCFLMNEVFRLCGWKGPAYMQAIQPTMEQVPMVHATGRYLEDGAVTDALSEQGQALVRDYLSLQYDWRHHFLYG